MNINISDLTPINGWHSTGHSELKYRKDFGIDGELSELVYKSSVVTTKFCGFNNCWILSIFIGTGSLCDIVQGDITQTQKEKTVSILNNIAKSIEMFIAKHYEITNKYPNKIEFYATSAEVGINLLSVFLEMTETYIKAHFNDEQFRIENNIPLHDYKVISFSSQIHPITFQIDMTRVSIIITPRT